MERHESVSVVILTKDEAANIGECLDAVLLQLREDDEIIVVDSASRDATVRICADYAVAHPGRVRVHAFPENVSFGEARNTGIEMSRHDIIAFVSADAVPDAAWLAALRTSIANADIVYGRQRHAPTSINAATVARGLRYHHFEREGDVLPETFASNVNAAYRRFAFDTLQFDDKLPGSEDVAFARRARLAGLRIAYAPDAIVHHKDVASLKAEWRKHLREGAAQAMLRDLLGAPKLHLAWATVVGVLGIAAVALASVWLLLATIVVFFAPTLRRLASPVAKKYRPHQLAGGAALSPIFDLAFVGSYLTRRAIKRG
ncbi:MAG TPA: glycosyltransferase [Candidatus Thermoplasmatota archaeon]|nr:glycosyltransferase [Candidatus Thermoplasmatota archaeon]